jgi:hypothetical protein
LLKIKFYTDRTTIKVSKIYQLLEPGGEISQILHARIRIPENSKYAYIKFEEACGSLRRLGEAW